MVDYTSIILSGVISLILMALIHQSMPDYGIWSIVVSVCVGVYLWMTIIGISIYRLVESCHMWYVGKFYKQNKL